MAEKTSIVLIHGHGVDASIWDDVYTGLTPDFTVIKPDFSRESTHETVEAYAEHLYSLLQAAQVESSVLIGHSMGGYIALAYAEKYPDLVKGLALIHSTAFADDDAKKEQRMQAVKGLQEKGTPAFIEATVPKMVGERFRTGQAGKLKELVSTFSELPADALIAGLRAMAARPDRTQVLKNAAYPVLIVAGTQDQLVPIEKSRASFELPPKPTTVELENVGHLGLIEAPAESTKAILDFVNTLTDDRN